VGFELQDEENVMDCVICKNGTTRPGHVTVTVQRGNTTVILKNVPAELCENCGEYYLSSDITAQVLLRAEQAVLSGAEIEVLRFAA
jgi:YgiT-type zinc finger domain-containing protein